MDDKAAGAPEGGPRIARAGSVLDPRVSLATSVHASPGVYALLLGSGASIGAGILTGWGIVQDLVSRAATAADPQNPAAGSAAAEDPEAWWTENGQGELGYSDLLAAVAPTPAARQAVLKTYFGPRPDETGEAVAAVPSPAHRAVAELVRRGSIRVVLTTNFDRLLEHALDELGVDYQVIHNPEGYDGATPLAHSPATVIKLHGDYLDLQVLNTVPELMEYTKAQKELLNRVLDEYGLIVCGWSGDWDHALVRAVEGTRSRRYPLFWSHLGPLGDAARKLTMQHNATLIPGMTADEFFPDIVHRLEALDHMAELPISRDMAVARLKRALPDPVRRIELAELVDQAVANAVERTNQERYPQVDGPTFEQRLRNYRDDTDTPLHLVATGVYYDDGRYDHLWIKAVQRLSRIRDKIGGRYDVDFESMRHYPALLAIWTAGVAAVLARHEELLPRLLTEPTWTSWDMRVKMIAAEYLPPVSVVNGERLTEFFPGGGGTWKYPQGRWVRGEAKEPLLRLEPDESTYEAACDRFEFLASMVALDESGSRNLPRAWHGEFFMNDFDSLAALIGQEIAPGWPMLGAFNDDVDRAETARQAVIQWKTKWASRW